MIVPMVSRGGPTGAVWQTCDTAYWAAYGVRHVVTAHNAGHADNVAPPEGTMLSIFRESADPTVMAQTVHPGLHGFRIGLDGSGGPAPGFVEKRTFPRPRQTRSHTSDLVRLI